MSNFEVRHDLSTLLQTDGSEPNKLVIMNADVVKVIFHALAMGLSAGLYHV